MTDITKCEGLSCQLRETCYRYTAPTVEPQSWSNFECSVYLDKRGNQVCIFFREILK